MLSQSVGYAVRALSCMESGTCPTRFVRDIAACTGIPGAYLAKVFKRLSTAGLVTAKRGWKGGTALARPANRISLLDICEAVDGPDWMPSCLLGLDVCAELQLCPTRRFWGRIRGQIARELRRITVSDVVRRERSARRSPRAGCDCARKGKEKRHAAGR